MVNYQERRLDRTFAALMDTTRCAILARMRASKRRFHVRATSRAGALDKLVRHFVPGSSMR
jgi:hypothetical protein